MMNEPKQPENLIIPMELVQTIGNYILSQPTTRPVNEAYQLITALQQLRPAPQQELKNNEQPTV